VDKISGVVIGSAMHLALQNKYRKVKSLNPLYRNFKTLAAAGTELGIVIGDLSRMPQVLATAIFALVLGVLAIPYWLYREHYYKETPVELLNKDYKTGVDGWSKYAKTFLVFGMYVGEAIGVFIALASSSLEVMRTLMFVGAIGSVVAFLVGLISVPIINKLTNGGLVTKKDVYRNNYVRSGITLGIALGSTFGYFLLPLILPALAPLATLAVGAAFGSILGGIAIGVYGGRITQYIQVNWHVIEDTDNSWDYATRNSSYLFGFAGAVIGFFVPVPGGALVGAAIGNAIASVVGWGLGLYVIRQARLTSREEQKALTLPWTQRIANGTMIGSMVGASLGFCLGLIGGAGGAVMGATLGFSAGAIAGGFAYGLWDKKARQLIYHFFRGESYVALVEEEKTKLLSPTHAISNDEVPSAQEVPRVPPQTVTNSFAAISTSLASASPGSKLESQSKSALETGAALKLTISPRLNPTPVRRSSVVLPLPQEIFKVLSHSDKFFSAQNSNDSEFPTAEDNEYSGIQNMFDQSVTVVPAF
jgi:MFS family permease